MDDTKRYERLLNRFRDGDISRRTFLTALGAAGVTAGITGGPMGMLARKAMAATPEQVRFDGWGGVVSEAFEKYAFAPYTEKTGIDVVSGTFGGADEYIARVKASQPGEFNLAHLSGVFDYARYHGLELTSELNEANIPNLKNVIPTLIDPLRKITGGTLSAVP